MPATVGCKRCGDPVTIAAAARTGGYCEPCTPKPEPVTLPTPEQQMTRNDVLRRWRIA